MIDQFHDDDLPLDTEKDFVCPSTSFGHRHPGGEDETFGDDLDRCVFACDGVFGDLYPACRTGQDISISTFPRQLAARGRAKDSPELPLPIVRPILHCPIIFASSLPLLDPVFFLVTAAPPCCVPYAPAGCFELEDW